MAIKKTKKKVAAKPAKKAVKAKKVVKAVKVAKAIQPKKVNLSGLKKPLTRAQTVDHLSTVTGIKKKEVAFLLESIVDVMDAHLNKKGPGEVNFAGIIKCRVINKPATKARQGINPFTGEQMTFAAKPARRVIKIRPLKRLKEIVA